MNYKYYIRLHTQLEQMVDMVTLQQMQNYKDNYV
jgi:hypothetical protein